LCNFSRDSSFYRKDKPSVWLPEKAFLAVNGKPEKNGLFLKKIIFKINYIFLKIKPTTLHLGGIRSHDP
jgi:hypothetical protein